MSSSPALYEGLMRVREELSETVLRREVERAGLDWPRLRREMDDGAITRRIEGNLALARALDDRERRDACAEVLRTLGPENAPSRGVARILTPWLDR